MAELVGGSKKPKIASAGVGEEPWIQCSHKFGENNWRPSRQ
jgi:hypothetical protein